MNVLTSEKSLMGRWKEYFEELMNEENERERDGKDVETETGNLKDDADL